MELTKLRQQVRVELQSAGFENPAREADLLMSAMSGRSLGELELDHLLGKALPPEEANRILRAARRRARREPLQYLAGTAPFFGLDFAVGPGVFVPRPETEQLVDFALAAIGEDAKGAVADIGSGSGAIAATVAALRPAATVHAFEASAFAWPWLLRNLRRHAPGVTAWFGDWHAQLYALSATPFAAILSNPPYVPEQEVPADPEVRLYDPEVALYSGGDGLREIRRIAVAARDLLAEGGLVAVEHTEQQGAPVRELFASVGLVGAATEPDLAGRDRFTWARQAHLPGSPGTELAR